MVSSVQSHIPVQQPVTPNPTQTTSKPPAPKAQPPDTVQISAAARQALSSDADHDGDKA